MQIVIEILQIEYSAKPMPPSDRKYKKTVSSFGVLNITNRKGKPANKDTYFANRRLNLHIEWPFLQIDLVILQIGNSPKWMLPSLMENNTFKK
ncbi:hypothetical protein C1N70_22860 [Cytobacillus firmus]